MKKLIKCSTNIKAAVKYDQSYMDKLITEVEGYAGNHLDKLNIWIQDNTFIVTGYDENGEKVSCHVMLRDLSLNSIEDDYDTICTDIEKSINRNFPKYEVEDYDWDLINEVYGRLSDEGIATDNDRASRYINRAVNKIAKKYNGDIDAWWDDEISNPKSGLNKLRHN